MNLRGVFLGRTVLLGSATMACIVTGCSSSSGPGAGTAADTQTDGGAATTTQPEICNLAATASDGTLIQFQYQDQTSTQVSDGVTIDGNAAVNASISVLNNALSGSDQVVAQYTIWAVTVADGQYTSQITNIGAGPTLTLTWNGSAFAAPIPETLPLRQAAEGSASFAVNYYQFDFVENGTTTLSDSASNTQEFLFFPAQQSGGGVNCAGFSGGPATSAGDSGAITICGTLPDGAYCGNDGIPGGDPNTIYQCQHGVLMGLIGCTQGCVSGGGGLSGDAGATPDYCTN
jgi:hypothetical protein